jgi:hypothetical protein
LELTELHSTPLWSGAGFSMQRGRGYLVHVLLDACH